jgi:hypothetical protein
MIAEYWADGPLTELPPGHSHLFGKCVSKRDKHTLNEDVKLFFSLSNALFDASLVAWDAKRSFDSVELDVRLRLRVGTVLSFVSAAIVLLHGPINHHLS